MQYETTETNGDEGYLQAQEMWLSVFLNSPELKKKFQWYYGDKDFPSSIYLLRESGVNTVLGAIGFVSRQYKLKANENVIGLCSDFAVIHKHQALGPAVKLLQSLVKGSSSKCNLLLGFPNNKAIAIMRRVGFHLLGDFSRYALILKSKPYICKTPLFYLRSLIIEPVDFVLRLYFRLSRCRNFSIYELTEILYADESFDNLWFKSTEKNNLYIGNRDSKYVNWRFLSNPYNDFRVFAFKHKDTQSLVGYAAVRVDDEGHWCVYDFYALTADDILKCLIQHLISIAIKENAISLSVEFLGDQDITDLFLNLKFSKRISDRRVIIGPLKESNEPSSELLNVNNWYITAADELG